MRVLFMGMHRPGRSPSQRFRFEQYLPYLRDHGVECDVSFLLGPSDDRIFYGPGNALQKARIAATSLDQRRVETTRTHLDRYDAVYIQREALFFGPPIIERRIARSDTALVFDFDDAIWIHVISASNRWASSLKFAHKTREIVGLADLVLAGNPYLADFARDHRARRVEVIPTTIDTAYHVPNPHPRPADAPVCIGWTGSFSTLVHLEGAVRPLRRIQERYGDRVTLRVIGDGSYRNEALGLTGLPWRLDTEIQDLWPIDIGIMPLPDDEWARGKCAFKGLQYMALAIPTVMSPVGVNTDIVVHGENGFLASTEDEWVDRLSQLIEDAELRRRMGAAGRQTIIDGYSVLSQRDRYLSLFRSLAR